MAIFSKGGWTAPLFLGGLPFAPFSPANGGHSSPALSTHCPLLTIHYSLASNKFADHFSRRTNQKLQEAFRLSPSFKFPFPLFEDRGMAKGARMAVTNSLLEVIDQHDVAVLTLI